MHLWIKDGQAQQELCVYTDRDKPSTTRLIDTMEKHNLVVRVPDQHDRRVKLIYLTHKGRELQKTLMDGIKDAEQEALHGIDEADVEVCLRVLCQVYANVSNE
jgi:DNA-binding MarR family transcriptional regulator